MVICELGPKVPRTQPLTYARYVRSDGLDEQGDTNHCGQQDSELWKTLANGEDDDRNQRSSDE